MESLAPLLHAFYTQPISSEQRSSIHHQLVASLSTPHHQHAAIAYIKTLSINSNTFDPYLLHHALHTLDTIARTAFSSLAPNDRISLHDLLFTFLIAAHATHLSKQPHSPRIPPHALNKAAAATVSLGKRLWLVGDSHFPNTLQRHLNSPAHSPSTLAAMLAGHAVLTTLLDDAQSTRRDLRAVDRTRLRSLIASHTTHFLPALEIALRAAGPSFPAHLAPAAARAVASLARLDRTAASEGATVLSRCVQDRRDPVAAALLTAVVDIASSATAIDPNPLVDSVAAALEALALGAAADTSFPPALLAAVDALTARLVRLPPPNAPLERLLNGLMGLSVRWAEHNPVWLPRALDTWIAVLEYIDDADDLRDSHFMQRVYPAVSQLCVSRALMATNPSVLNRLPTRKRDTVIVSNSPDTPIPRPAPAPEWDAGAELAAEVARQPHGPSTAALFFEKRAMGVDVVRDGGENGTTEDGPGAEAEDDDEDEEEEEEDNESWDLVSRDAFVSKCIETVVIIAQMSAPVANDAAQLVVSTISSHGPTVVAGGMTGAVEDGAQDLTAVASLAFGLTGVLAADSPPGRAVLESTVDLIGRGAWRRVRLGVTLLRAAAALTGVLGAAMEVPDGTQYIKRVGTILVNTSREILSDIRTGTQLQSAAAVTLCSLDDSVRDTLSGGNAPLDVDAISRASRPAACIGAARLARWAVVPRRTRGVRSRWSDEEWARRNAGLRSLMERLVPGIPAPGAQGEGLGELARICGILRTMAAALRDEGPRPASALWEAVGVRLISSGLLSDDGITAIVALARSAQGRVRGMAWAVAAGAVAAVGEVVALCGTSASHVVTRLLEVARNAASAPGGARVALAVVRVVRERVSAGDSKLVPSAVELAVGVLRDSGGDGTDAGELALSLLGEALRRHWPTFWPGDRVMVGNDATGGNDSKVNPDEATRGLYGMALRALVDAAGAEELTVTRAALHEVSRLHAARRLFAREAAFKETGAGMVLGTHCLRVLGAGGDARRESVSDEAIDVLWGMCGADGKWFMTGLRNMVREVAGAGGTVDERSVESLCSGIETDGGRADFARRMCAMASDMVYVRSLEPCL